MICRLCLENLNVESAIRLFDSLSEGFGNSDVVAMITKYFQLELTPEDSVSTRICQVCFEHLEDFNRFWKRIDKKQQSLQEQYKAEFLEVKCGDLSAEQLDDLSMVQADGDNLVREDEGDAILPIKFEREDIEESVEEPNDMMLENVDASVFCKVESDDEDSDDSSESFMDDFEPDSSFSSDDDVPLKTFEEAKKDTSTKSKSKNVEKTTLKKKKIERKPRDRNPTNYMELGCQLCEHKIKNFHELVVHFKDKHTDKEPFVKCCEKTLAERRQYAAHMKWHRDADKSKCKICGIILSSERSLKSHMQSKHEKDEQLGDSLSCDQCEKSFSSKKIYVNHLKWHENQGQYICEICSKAYTNEIHLKRHVQTIHNHVYPYKCPACGEFFNFKEELDAHDAVCEVKPLLKPDGQGAKKNEACICKVCNKIFARPKYLKRHMKAVHANIAPMVCDQCGKNFKCRPTFEKHVLEHSGVIVDQPVQCEKCGKWCKNKKSHSSHLSRHYEICNKCHLCGRECPSRRALKGHMETVHRNEKNFKCQHCDKSFKSALILKEHVAKHTGENLYTCPHCPKEFRSRANKYSHIKKSHVDEWIKSKLARSYDPNLTAALN